MKVTTWIAVKVILMTLAQTRGEKIIMMPAIIKSHVAMMTTLAEELISRGHEIHLVIRDDFTVSSRLLSMRGLHFPAYEKEEFDETVDALHEKVTQTVLNYNGDFSRIMSNLSSICLDECVKFTMKNDRLIKQLDNLKADIVIIDAFFMTKCLYVVPHRLGLPVISMVDTPEPWPMRVPYLPSFVPTKVLSYSDEMTFFQRLANTALHIILAAFPPFHTTPFDVIEEYRKYGYFDSVDDLLSRSLLWLHTTHPVLDYPIPSLPNMVKVGGLTTRPAEALPADLANVVTSSQQGVIVVTFGSIASHLPKMMSLKFLEAFSEFPEYTFIWRFTNPDNLEIPKNVIAKSWIPQNDLLGRPEVKLFLSHCGKNGLYEAVYHGVPVLGVPMMGDQPYNAKVIETKGYGSVINVYDFTVQELVGKINRCLEDPSYRENMKSASQIFHDDPEKPQQRARRAIEHVLKFGARHLTSSAVHLTWYQYWLLDVTSFILAVLLIIVVAVWKIFRCGFHWYYRSNEKKLKKQ